MGQFLINIININIVVRKLQRGSEMWKNLHDKDKSEVEKGGQANKLEEVFVETPKEEKNLRSSCKSVL